MRQPTVRASHQCEPVNSVSQGWNGAAMQQCAPVDRARCGGDRVRRGSGASTTPELHRASSSRRPPHNAVTFGGPGSSSHIDLVQWPTPPPAGGARGALRVAVGVVPAVDISPSASVPAGSVGLSLLLRVPLTHRQEHSDPCHARHVLFGAPLARVVTVVNGRPGSWLGLQHTSMGSHLGWGQPTHCQSVGVCAWLLAPRLKQPLVSQH